MYYCVNCLQPSTRPNGHFNQGELCPACVYNRHKDSEPSLDEFIEIVNKFKQNSDIEYLQKYDCLIGVSGGKDSTRQAFWVKNKLKLNPLLVCVGYPPEQVTQTGMSNLGNLVDSGFDLITMQPSPKVWKKLMKHGFLSYGNWARSTELALFSGVPQLAIKYNIPLIFWGENPALTLGDTGTLSREGWNGNKLKNMNTLSGGSYEWLLEGTDIKRNQIFPYIYPSIDEYQSINLQIIFLSHILTDWNLRLNGIISGLRGLDYRKDNPKNTQDLFGFTSLDEDFVIVNQRIKYLKYGFGRATDYVNEAIRNSEITREEGIEIVQEYDGRCSKNYINEFCNYLGISTKLYNQVIRKYVNYDLFAEKSNGQFVPRFKIGKGL
jgi:N-acetyl sugar amidotransferase